MPGLSDYFVWHMYMADADANSGEGW